MSVPDLEITEDPGTVWRVGFEPDPWAWTPWIYATDAGLFDGRWDDQHGAFRTLYTSASLLGCFLELLAKHRPEAIVEDALAEIDDPADLAAHDLQTPPGAIGYDWLEGRRLGRANLVGRYCFITHSRSVAAVDRAGQFAAHGIPSRDVDAALLKNAEDRVLTRSVARWVYDLRNDNDRNELVDGIEFRSRLGDEIHMWAVFERLPDETKRHRSSSPQSGTRLSPLIPPSSSTPFHASDCSGINCKGAARSADHRPPAPVECATVLRHGCVQVRGSKSGVVAGGVGFGRRA